VHSGRVQRRVARRDAAVRLSELRRGGGRLDATGVRVSLFLVHAVRLPGDLDFTAVTVARPPGREDKTSRLGVSKRRNCGPGLDLRRIPTTPTPE